MASALQMFLSGDISTMKGTIIRSFIISIIHQDLSSGGITLKIELVVFVYELINYIFIDEIIVLRTWLCKKI